MISLLALGAAFSGCNIIPAAQTDPTKFYVLTGTPPNRPEFAVGTTPAPSASPEAKKVRLGLKTVEVATYLKGPEMVVRSGSNEVTMMDYARWAEPIQAGVSRILRQQLADAEGVARVDVQPFPLDQVRDYDIAVTILHCEGATGGAEGKAARFEASIRITTAGLNPELVARKNFVALGGGQWDGRDFDKLAQLLSADVQELGKAILQIVPPAAR